MNFNIKKCLLLVLTGYPLAMPWCHAQEKSIRHTNQQWMQYYGQVQLTERLQLTGDTGFRWKDGFAARSQYVLRAGLNYRLMSGFQVGGGIGYFGSYGSDGLDRVEYRPYQDLGFRHQFRYFQLVHRARLEERIFHQLQLSGTQKPEDFHLRFRYALTASIPLFSLSAINPDRKMLLLLGDEVFLNIGRQTIPRAFDLNRILISPTLAWNKNFSVSVSWASQYASSQDPATYVHTDILWLQVRQQFDVLNKRKPE